MTILTSSRIVVAAALAVLVGVVPVAARSPPDAQAEIALAALPEEAQHTLQLIARGAPLPYHRDGIVFGNREKHLPARARGYYHEYTVPTPGVKTRGARRIICGGDARSTEECYYSDDHYQSFRRIRP